MEHSAITWKHVIYELLALIFKITLIAIVIYLISTKVTIYRVKDDSMKPMVRENDLCLFSSEKQYYINDVVIYTKDGEEYTGRIKAIPGQSVKIAKNRHLYINEYDDGSGEMNAGTIEYPLTVDDNSVFILNDNKEDMDDSRTFGCIDIATIKSKMIFLARQVNHEAKITDHNSNH